MTNYDFSVLNDKEFEAFVADLLSEHFRVRIERFRVGPDKGVDGRWFASPKQEVVIQCKHWPKTPLPTLLSHLRKKELPKIRKLGASRYLFVCSQELTRANKEKIYDLLTPHIKAHSDIFGAEDLQDLLIRLPEVERRHQKVWLSSASVLVALFNNNVMGRSEDALLEIKNSLSRYVETEEAARAREKLDQLRVLIIKGEPGVGKTTVAQQLVTEAVAQGYRLIVVERDIAEVENIFDAESPQIFYFDDFLGRNFLEALTDNKDSHIVNFIKRIRRHPKKRFVLTTRTHILDGGKAVSELFRIEKIAKNEFELSVGQLSRIEKGKILYSHIWNSGLPEWAIDAIYENHRYLSIIDHKNYNPRIISFITDPERIVETDPVAFWKYVQSTLTYPEAIWRHVFDKQLSKDSRDLAILTAYNGAAIEQDDLQQAFVRLNRETTDNQIEVRHKFIGALRLAVGSVLNRSLDGEGDVRVSLFNPSIADYLLRDTDILSNINEIFRSLRTLSSLRFLISLNASDRISDSVCHSCLHLVVLDLVSENSFQGAYADRLAAVVWDDNKDPRVEKFCHDVANCMDVEDLEALHPSSAALWASSLCGGKIDGASAKFESVLASIGIVADRPDFIKPFQECAAWLDAIDGGSRASHLRESVVQRWLDDAQAIVSGDGILDDFRDLDELSSARDAVESYIESKFGEMGLEIRHSEVRTFSENIDFENVLERNNSYEPDFDRDGVVSARDDDNSDRAIIDHFDRSDSSAG